MAPWTELNPIIVEFVALINAFYGIVFVIVFGVAIFGVANTMLMSTYERRREIAVMLAMGATPGSVVKTVLYEAGAMGILALALGIGISLPLMLWWNIAPIDLSRLYGDLTIQGALLRPVLRVELNLAYWIWGGVALVATALLAALYPAARAARIPPADALSGL